MKKYNFSPGPTKIKESILEKVEENILEYRDTGVSILEISHRSSDFADILLKTKENLRLLLDVPSNYKILFLQGGATFHNAFIANNINKNYSTSNLITGTWGQKSYEDFCTIRNTKKIILPNKEIEHYLKILQQQESQKIDYMHITSNETIEGIQLREFNHINSDLIIDSSSDIGSYKFDWNNVAYLYAGAQKNLGIPGVTISIVRDDFIEENSNPTYLNLYKLINKDSLLNTPPTFSIYVLKLVTDWMIDLGGVDYFESQSIEFSTQIYSLLNRFSEYVSLPVADYSKSRMNIVFNFKNELHEKLFIEESQNNNIIGIKGHRSVGGIRVSLYNSIDKSTYQYLMEFMETFFLKL